MKSSATFGSISRHTLSILFLDVHKNNSVLPTPLKSVACKLLSRLLLEQVLSVKSSATFGSISRHTLSILFLDVHKNNSVLPTPLKSVACKLLSRLLLEQVLSVKSSAAFGSISRHTLSILFLDVHKNNSVLSTPLKSVVCKLLSRI